MTKSELRDTLNRLSDEKYRAFHLKLQPSKSCVLGVRMGELRKTAKGLSKNNWMEYIDALEINDSYEEKLIAGMSIFYANDDINSKIEYLNKMMVFIDGWAMCDSICTTIKLKTNERQIFWEFTLKCANSPSEFESRVGFVSMLHSFIEEEHIQEIINCVNTKEFAGYYESMAAAWLLADCMVKFPELVFEYMKRNDLNDWVHNKAISKMRESYRVTKEMKLELSKLIRKTKKAE